MTYLEWMRKAEIVKIDLDEADVISQRAKFIPVHEYRDWSICLPYELGMIGKPYGTCVRFVLTRVE